MLLGAAALLADMLDRLDAQYKATPPPGFLGQLERNSRRSGLASLQGNLTELAAEAAADDAQRTRKFLSFLGSIPSERTELRHALIDHLDKLVTSPETLSEVLPYLYSALVGAQALERGAAAKTIGEIYRICWTTPHHCCWRPSSPCSRIISNFLWPKSSRPSNG